MLPPGIDPLWPESSSNPRGDGDFNFLGKIGKFMILLSVLAFVGMCSMSVYDTHRKINDPTYFE